MNMVPYREKRGEHDGHRNRGGSLVHLRNEIDTLFERFFGEARPWTAEGSSFMSPWGQTPRVNVAESDDDVVITAELPGVNPKDVDIKVTGNVLTIRGEKAQEQEEKKRNYHYVERSFGSFQRRVPLPNSVDANRIEAVHKNGVLTVTLKKQPAAKPRRIAVKTG